MIDLEAIFGDPPKATSVTTAVAASDAAPMPVLEVDLNLLAPFAWWQRRPDVSGRMGWEAPALPEADRWWADGNVAALPEATAPCPRCGGLELWQDPAGGWHCQRCDGDVLRRSRDLTARAARLRAAGRAKAAPQDCAGGAPGPRVDALELPGNRPVQGHLQEFDGT